MSEVANPTFIINADSDPVIIRIEGRASFQNSSTLRDFMGEMHRQGKSRYVIDFAHCSSMDSTFLGVLAGVALELRKLKPAGSLVCCRVAPRNLELIQNLGLHRLVTVDTDEFGACVSDFNQPGKALAAGAKLDELANARLVLAAHENLVSADEQNLVKFQDVLSFLKGRIEQG